MRLWYVDCFAGPWKARDQELRDTSISIGLTALESVAQTWGTEHFLIELGAIFVEKNQHAFKQLGQFLANRSELVRTHPLPGEFGQRIGEIEQLIQSDPAFVFVDPTGWKGVAMDFIAPLVKQPRRDVLINVMFNDVNRFKDDPRAFLREQMRTFFGLKTGDLPPGMSETQLIRFYRSRLKSACSMEFALDLAVPHPLHARTKLRLVVGGHNREVVRLFRDVERKVLGVEASTVRVKAKERRNLERTGQMPLLHAPPPEHDDAYEKARTEGLEEVRSYVPERLRQVGPLEYWRLWPAVLEECHITATDLKSVLVDMRRSGAIVVPNWAKADRSIKDHHLLRLPTMNG